MSNQLVVIVALVAHLIYIIVRYFIQIKNIHYPKIAIDTEMIRSAIWYDGNISTDFEQKH